MKRVVVTGESQCGLEDFDDPGVAENYAKIKIHAAPAVHRVPCVPEGHETSRLEVTRLRAKSSRSVRR